MSAGTTITIMNVKTFSEVAQCHHEFIYLLALLRIWDIEEDGAHAACPRLPEAKPCTSVSAQRG